MNRPVIVKIGGSLIQYDNGEVLSCFGSILSQSVKASPMLVVPGGGPFADTVRRYDQLLGLREETCHFMALSAMDQFAFLLAEHIPGSKLIDLADSTDLNDLMPPTPGILLCSRYIRQIPDVDLPRSWDVTSDSIAAFLAQRMNSRMLVILKSKDIDPELQLPDVDPFYRRLLPLRMPVWFINGLFPERLSELLQTGSTRGVYIAPDSTHGQCFF